MATVTLTPQFDSAATFSVGKEIIIPFVVTSQTAVDIDGVQVAFTLSGASVSNVKLVNYPEAHLTALTAAATTQGAQAMLATENLGQPLTIVGSVPVVGLSFIPESNGTIQIQFNQEETLVAEHGSSQNILVEPTPVEVVIGDVVTPEQPAATDQIQEQIPLPNQLDNSMGSTNLFVWGTIGVVVIVVLAVIGYLIWKRFRQPSAVVPPQPTSMVTPPVAPPVETQPTPLQTLPPSMPTTPPSQPPSVS